MKRILYEPDMEKLNEFQAILDSYAIATIISTPNITSVEASPLPKCFPFICVVNDDDYGRAKQIIRKYFTSLENESQATCPNCGDTNPGDYLFCWSCDTTVEEDN